MAYLPTDREFYCTSCNGLRADYSKYDRLDSLVQSALKSGSQRESESSVRRTVSINTGLMWDILDHTCAKNTSSGSKGRGLFDPTFVRDKPPSRIRLHKRSKRGAVENFDSSDDEDVVETQIFHHPNPTTDVDTSNGGQEFPPYARRTRSQNNVNEHTATNTERSTHSAPAAERPLVSQLQDQPPVQQDTALVTWPADDMWMSASMMDVSNDAFFQFQDHDIPWTGSWDVGNL